MRHLPSLAQHAMESLGNVRPAFHSEADFQHAFASRIQQLDPSIEVRLEVPMSNPRGELDLLLKQGRETLGIELKYARGAATLLIDGGRFDLIGNDPKDVARYAFWKDVARLEQWVTGGQLTGGAAVMISNASECWRVPIPRESNHDAFRVHEGQKVSGLLDWRRVPPNSHLWPPLTLRASYECRWSPYSLVPSATNGEFKFLMVNVEP